VATTDENELPGGRQPDRDDVLVALADLMAAADQVEAAVQALRRRAAQLERERSNGVAYRDLVREEHRPLIAELLTDTIKRFEAAGTRFRQAEARALHRDGLTMGQIAELFGLTRQRISVLLRPAAPADDVSADDPSTSRARRLDRPPRD
jgi:hypothetical protein